MSESVRLAPRVFIDAMDDIAVETSFLMKKRGLRLTLDEARATLCPPRLHAGIAMGARAIRGDHGLRYPIRGGVVVTCLTREMYG